MAGTFKHTSGPAARHGVISLVCSAVEPTIATAAATAVPLIHCTSEPGPTLQLIHSIHASGSGAVQEAGATGQGAAPASASVLQPDTIRHKPALPRSHLASTHPSYPSLSFAYLPVSELRPATQRGRKETAEGQAVPIKGAANAPLRAPARRRCPQSDST